MNKYLLSVAAVAIMASSAPASAQFGNVIQDTIRGLFDGNGSGFSNRLAGLDQRIRDAFQRGEISSGEAQRLRDELFDLRQLEERYRQGGLDRNERFELQQRLERFERRFQDARDDRGDRYDRDDRDDRDNRWDNDDRDYGRNGCPPGLAKKNNGCLPPGQAKKIGDRYDDSYGRVPSQFGDRYRDTQRYTYRSDGSGRIYQIDRRTGRIVRVIDARR